MHKRGPLSAKRGRSGHDEVAVLCVRLPTLASERSASLSPTERQVAELVVGGATSAEIAAKRSVSLRTVENQIGAIFRKTGTRSRAELIALLVTTTGHE